MGLERKDGKEWDVWCGERAKDWHNGFAVSRRLLWEKKYETCPVSVGVRASSNEFEGYHEREKLLLGGLLKC